MTIIKRALNSRLSQIELTGNSDPTPIRSRIVTTAECIHSFFMGKPPGIVMICTNARHDDVMEELRSHDTASFAEWLRWYDPFQNHPRGDTKDCLRFDHVRNVNMQTVLQPHDMLMM